MTQAKGSAHPSRRAFKVSPPHCAQGLLAERRNPCQHQGDDVLLPLAQPVLIHLGRCAQHGINGSELQLGHGDIVQVSWRGHVAQDVLQFLQ